MKSYSMKNNIYKSNRKISFISGSAFVTLPLGWVRQNNLEENRNVRVSITANGEVLIVPNRQELSNE
jgi:antitoxin component of MazEF toxin-antitoxin module